MGDLETGLLDWAGREAAWQRDLLRRLTGGDPVQVTRIAHLEGVNDLAAGATLDFEPTGLTIIAGSNGTGKSGCTKTVPDHISPLE